jgi:hypothetical protein
MSSCFNYAKHQLFRSFVMDACAPHMVHPHKMPRVKQVSVGVLEFQRKRLRSGMGSVSLFTFLKGGAVNPLRKLLTRSTNFVASKRAVGILGVQMSSRAQKGMHGPSRNIKWMWPFIMLNYNRYVYDALKVKEDTVMKRPKYLDKKWDSLTVQSWLDPEERKKNFMLKRYIDTSGRLQVRLNVSFTKRHLPSNMAYLHFFRIPVVFSKNKDQEKQQGSSYDYE